MANYSNLIAGIDAVIKTNGRQEISGTALNTQLKNMISELGAGYQFMGIATPVTNPGTPDANVFYLASEAGTYTNFGGIVINEGEVCALVWNGSWTKQVTGAATADKLNQLGQELIGRNTEITEADVTSESGKWDNNNGVIGTASSGALHRASPISLSDVSSFDLTVEMSWANTPVAYICDDAGNVLESINRQSEDPTVLTGITVPSGATKLYVNYATYFTFKHFVSGRLEEIEQDIDDFRGEIGGEIQTVQENLDNAVEQYAAVAIADNTTPMDLSESEFESGNLQGGTGAELSATNVIRTADYLAVVPGITITYSSANLYRISFFEFDKNKAWKWNTNWLTGAGTHTIREDCEYIRIVVSSPSGVTTAPIWSDIELSVILSKTYQFTRAAAESAIEKKVGEYFNIELPLLSPSPQLPANEDSTSDINAETMTSTSIQAAIESVIGKLPIPSKDTYPNNPRYGTIYGTIGRDASNQYEIKAYVFTKRNRFCWRASAALYAWVSGGTTYFTDHRSPLVGDSVYSDANRTNSGYTVTAYNSATPSITVNGNSYTRNDLAKIEADDVFTQTEIANGSTSISTFRKDGTSAGNATISSSNTITLSSKTYTRYSSGDYHTDNKATIVLWGNEHGPQSDPNEPSIILYRLVKDLCEGCSNNPFLSYLRGYCKIVIIPAANPYGVNIYQSGGYGRNNYNNVNINRNYDTIGWSVQQDTDKGSYAGDQPETQFIMNTVLDMDADVAIDIHCLGYETAHNEGKCHHEGRVTELNSKVGETMSGYCGLSYSSYGSENPDNGATGADWIFSLGISGGLIEMNAGPYSTSFNGEQHSDVIMFANYTLLLNALRMWYYGYDSTLDLSRMFIK